MASCIGAIVRGNLTLPALKSQGATERNTGKMPRYVSAVPAYGRDYKSAKAVKEDWADGKDFLIQDVQLSGYINKDDKPADIVLHIRYSRLTRVCEIR